MRLARLAYDRLLPSCVNGHRNGDSGPQCLLKLSSRVSRVVCAVVCEAFVSGVYGTRTFERPSYKQNCRTSSRV